MDLVIQVSDWQKRPTMDYGRNHWLVGGAIFSALQPLQQWRFLALHCSVLRRLLGGREGGTIPPDSIVGSRSGGERSKGGMHCIYTLI